MKCLPNLLAQRRDVSVSGGEGREYVCDVGDYFKAQGLTRPTLQLLHALLSMEGSLVKQVSGGEKWTDSLQLLRLIAAPGMGKVCCDSCDTCRQCRAPVCAALQ